MSVTNCAESPLPLSEFLHLNHTLSRFKESDINSITQKSHGKENHEQLDSHPNKQVRQYNVK